MKKIFLVPLFITSLSYEMLSRGNKLGNMAKKVKSKLNHLACIMDGNRRWAKQKGWRPWIGHNEGMTAAKRAASFCIDNDIRFLTLYVFSLENFNRPKLELDYLFHELVKESDNLLQDFKKQNIKARFVGDRSRFPQNIIPIAKKMEEETKDNTALFLDLLFCYGGCQEILSATKKISEDFNLGKIKDIDESVLRRYLWTYPAPDPDLIIRTGGQQRLSNFLPLQSTYSELYFVDTLWPDIQNDDLQKAVDYYNNQKRNFGK